MPYAESASYFAQDSVDRTYRKALNRWENSIQFIREYVRKLVTQKDKHPVQEKLGFAIQENI